MGSRVAGTAKMMGGGGGRKRSWRPVQPPDPSGSRQPPEWALRPVPPRPARGGRWGQRGLGPEHGPFTRCHRNRFIQHVGESEPHWTELQRSDRRRRRGRPCGRRCHDRRGSNGRGSHPVGGHRPSSDGTPPSTTGGTGAPSGAGVVQGAANRAGRVPGILDPEGTGRVPWLRAERSTTSASSPSATSWSAAPPASSPRVSSVRQQGS